jgi:hypothetical protein
MAVARSYYNLLYCIVEVYKLGYFDIFQSKCFETAQFGIIFENKKRRVITH